MSITAAPHLNIQKLELKKSQCISHIEEIDDIQCIIGTYDQYRQVTTGRCKIEIVIDQKAGRPIYKTLSAVGKSSLKDSSALLNGVSVTFNQKNHESFSREAKLEAHLVAAMTKTHQDLLNKKCHKL